MLLSYMIHLLLLLRCCNFDTTHQEPDPIVAVPSRPVHVSNNVQQRSLRMKQVARQHNSVGQEAKSLPALTQLRVPVLSTEKKEEKESRSAKGCYHK